MDTLGGFIFVGVVGLFIYFYLKNRGNKNPFKTIVGLEQIAKQHKRGILEYVEESIAGMEKRLQEKSSFIGLEKSTRASLEDLKTFRESTLPDFENQYVQLKEKFKFNTGESLKVAQDYCDWFVNYGIIYNKTNFGLYSATGSEAILEENKKASIRVGEIEKRLSERAK